MSSHPSSFASNAAVHEVRGSNPLFAVNGASREKTFEPMEKIGEGASFTNGKWMVHSILYAFFSFIVWLSFFDKGVNLRFFRQ